MRFDLIRGRAIDADWTRASTIVGVSLLVMYAVSSHIDWFADLNFLISVLAIEVVILAIWKFEQLFFLLLIGAFLWAGVGLPWSDTWKSGRWVILAVGGVFGFVNWIRRSDSHLGAYHFTAILCALSAFVSATVSDFVPMASFKALSLLLLMVFCSTGARAAVIGREQAFCTGMKIGCEILVYAAAISYFVLRFPVFGNPNSLGSAMTIIAFPFLSWGWLTSPPGWARWRRFGALLLSILLLSFSMERAGIATVVITTAVFCMVLRQYRLLLGLCLSYLVFTAVLGIVAPNRLSSPSEGVKNDVLYKGHLEQGFVGSRLEPWIKTLHVIEEHPLFGTGYGTSPTGEDPGLNFGTYSSTPQTAREHGSSYMMITEWVGLLGIAPFLLLLVGTVVHVVRALKWLRKTSNFYHYAVPVAAVVFSGLVHAAFEDWMFAVGSYFCVFFWINAFVLADLLPGPPSGGAAVSHATGNASAYPGIGSRANHLA